MTDLTIEPLALGQRVVAVLETGLRTATYKLATLMALVDHCIEYLPAWRSESWRSTGARSHRSMASASCVSRASPMPVFSAPSNDCETRRQPATSPVPTSLVNVCPRRTARQLMTSRSRSRNSHYIDSSGLPARLPARPSSTTTAGCMTTFPCEPSTRRAG